MLKQIFTSKLIIAIEIIVIAFFGFNLVKQVLQRHAIESEVERLEKEIGKLEKDQDDLGSLLKYVQTDEFVEQEARSKLNLVKTGESLVVIPEVDADQEEETNYKPEVLGDSNIKLWWKYFFDNDSLWLD